MVVPAAGCLPARASHAGPVACALQGTTRIAVAVQPRSDYHRSMHVTDPDCAAAAIAAAIGENARARMLYCLSDGRARTSTELAVVAEVSPSTASAHLNRLKAQRLVRVFAQGKHHYYSLEGPKVAEALEALSVLAGGTSASIAPRAPGHLRAARTCYDHIAGALGVGLHDRFVALGWLSAAAHGENSYDLTRKGPEGFRALGIDAEAARALRRRFAFACVDWSERRPHLGGALGAAVLHAALKRKWVVQDLDSRALEITSRGRREISAHLELHF
jgi:DNA-binding transcriptional ArsR family regulator